MCSSGYRMCEIQSLSAQKFCLGRMRGSFLWFLGSWHYFSLAPTRLSYIRKAGILPQSIDRSDVQCLTCRTNTWTCGWFSASAHKPYPSQGTSWWAHAYTLSSGTYPRSTEYSIGLIAIIWLIAVSQVSQLGSVTCVNLTNPIQRQHNFLSRLKRLVPSDKSCQCSPTGTLTGNRSMTNMKKEWHIQCFYEEFSKLSRCANFFTNIWIKSREIFFPWQWVKLSTSVFLVISGQR